MKPRSLSVKRAVLLFVAARFAIPGMQALHWLWRDRHQRRGSL